MTDLKFQIEQIALCPRDPEAAKKLLTDMGGAEWAEDIVVASGEVFSEKGSNTADLSFDYNMLENARELEILHYRSGPNWMDGRVDRVSHLGMHCTAGELNRWREFFMRRDIRVAQEVKTESHCNPVIAGKRWFHYVIFDTYDILGVDVKFIVRRDYR